MRAITGRSGSHPPLPRLLPASPLHPRRRARALCLGARQEELGRRCRVIARPPQRRTVTGRRAEEEKGSPGRTCSERLDSSIHDSHRPKVLALQGNNPSRGDPDDRLEDGMEEGHEDQRAVHTIVADLVFSIDEKPHVVFTQDGNSLLATQKIPLADDRMRYTVYLTTPYVCAT